MRCSRAVGRRQGAVLDISLHRVWVDIDVVIALLRVLHLVGHHVCWETSSCVLVQELFMSGNNVRVQLSSFLVKVVAS